MPMQKHRANSLSFFVCVSVSLAQELIDLLRKLCGSSGQDFSIYEAVLRVQSKMQSEARLMCYCGNGKSNWYDEDDDGTPLLVVSSTSLFMHTIYIPLLRSFPRRTFRLDGAPKRERDKMDLPAAIRDIREVAVEENAFSFFTAMGYELSYEILRKGESFVLVG